MSAGDKQFGIFAGAVVLVLLIVAGINLYQARNAVPGMQIIPYSRFLDDVEHGQVRTVTVNGHDITGQRTDKSYFRTVAAEDPDLVRALRAKNVAINAITPPATGQSWGSTLTTLLPTVLFIIVAIWLFNRTQGGGGMGGMTRGLGKSKARMLTEAHGRVTFQDVAGVDEAKDDLQEIVDFLRDPTKFQRLGGHIPRGVLLVGPPGSGKTLLARAIAGEAGVPFFTISGSDFVEMFVGIGAARIRDMFIEAKKNAPCIIFVDEIDAVGRKRGAGVGGGNDEREQTLNQLLVEMDGFASNAGVILIAATNRPDVLDPALLRPGRFDREIVVSHPDVLGRENILKIHVRKMPLTPRVDLKTIARRTPGFSGADLMNLVNEAALLAVRRGRQQVGMREFDDAKDRVLMGVERRSHVMSENERRLTAYRESGHAIIALHVPACDPVHKITIIPRGRSMGQTKQLPENDQTVLTLEQMTSKLAVLMGGRAAEELVFGRDQVTSGSANDLEQATKLARNMVTRWGLSEELGAVVYGENQEEVFLGNSVTRTHDISDETAQTISLEVRKLLDAALARARGILSAHRSELDTLANGLLQYETLSGDEIRGLLVGTPPSRDPSDEQTVAAPETAPVI